MSESERSTSSSPGDPFASADGPPGDIPDPSSFSEEPDFSGELGPRVSMVWNMARMWIRENQKASMLGAFAVGVFAGAWLRD